MDREQLRREFRKALSALDELERHFNEGGPLTGRGGLVEVGFAQQDTLRAGRRYFTDDELLEVDP